MQSHIKIITLIFLTILTTVSAAEVETQTFPYAAQVTEDNVNIRSGPGTNYYSCGKLNQAERVKVVSSQFSWSRIVPPKGSFSWISKQYVRIDTTNPDIGFVTGDSVRVYAGSNRVKPIHSTTLQGKLNKTDKVQLLGEEMGDYYKISPPAFAYLWVSSRYLEPLDPAEESPLETEAGTKIGIKAITETTEDTTPAEVIAIIETSLSLESQKLNKYYSLKKQITAQRNKPISQQNYAKIKKALAAIAKNKKAGKATRYSKFALGQIERYELAGEVEKTLKLQDEQIKKVQDRIDQAHKTKQEAFVDLSSFTVVGEFTISSIYGEQEHVKHYRVVDGLGKTLCYALPAGKIESADLNEFVGSKVGLNGTVEPHEPTSSALIWFTEIVSLK